MPCPATERSHCQKLWLTTSDGEVSQNRQENTPENRRQRQTLPLRLLPQEKPETCQGASAVVLPDLPETDRANA